MAKLGPQAVSPRPKQTGFIRLLLSLALVILAWSAPIAFAQAAISRFDLPSQPLADSLRALGSQTNLNVLFDPPLVAAHQAPALKGAFTTTQAFTLLLVGTGIQHEFLNERTVVLAAAPGATADAAALTASDVAKRPERAAPDSSAARYLAGSPESDNVSFWGRFRLTQANQEQPPADKPVEKPGTSPETKRAELEEIIVTANRRKQRAQDVPGTLQAFRGSDLEEQGAEGFADYLATVPGLGFRSQGNGTSKITIRGISNIGGFDSGWGTTTTTGLYLNDVSVQGADVPPDLVLYDLDRIEVLKGPQGTLYGEGAMGGAIKMILNAPNLSEFEGKADLSVSSTKSGELNYGVRGAVNFPLIEDRVALRLTGTYRDEEGFVENVARGEENHDDKRVYSIRGVLAAKVTSTLSAEILAFHNALRMDDYPQIDSLDGYRISSVEDRYNHVDSTLVGLTLKNDFGFAELTSVTSNLRLDRDFVEPVMFGRFFFAPYGPITQDPYQTPTNLKSFSQELRLVSQGDNRLDWVVGAFYRDKKQDAHNRGTIVANDLAAINAGLAAASLPQLGADGLYFESSVVHAYEQYALYGEGNLELGHGFELTAGLRWYDEEVNLTVTTVGYSLVADCCTNFNVLPTIREKGVIPKFVLSYKASDDNLIYAQAAKGFRPGAANANLPLGGDEGADSDSLWSYEIGSKNSFAEGRAIFNASAFYLDWKGIQSHALLFSPVLEIDFPFLENAGDAEIYGIEAELAASATDAFTFGAAFGYTHSELTKSLGNGLVGSVLPGTPKWTASGYGEYSVPTSLGEAFIRLDVRYAGEQNAKLVQVDALGNSTYDGTPLDAYIIGNIRLGLNRDNGWGVTFFVDNLWNERAELGAGLDGGNVIVGAQRFSIERPRTYGLSVSTSF